MPLLATLEAVPPMDRRQSQAALKIRRGAARLLRDLTFAVIPEVTLASGRRADLVGLGPKGEIWIVEIKSSAADVRADGKWPSYKAHCDALYFAAPPELSHILPPAEGLIVTDGYDAEIVRPAALRRLAQPARRSLHLRIAQTAARRLHELEDPCLAPSVPL